MDLEKDATYAKIPVNTKIPNKVETWLGTLDFF